MSSSKLTTVYGLLLKPDSAYRAGDSVSAATDGILMASPAIMTRGHVNDGSRGLSPSGMAPLKRAAPSGKTASLPVPVEFRGSGQAYASGVKADDLHSLMRIAGYGAVVDATASAEKWTFTPEGWDSAVPPTFASGVGELYGRGEMIPLEGAYASMGFEIEAGGIALFTFDVQGVPGNKSETALPSITYMDMNVIPPKFDAPALTLGNFTGAKVRSVRFAQNREITTRSIHGYAAGRRAPELVVEIEAASLATSSPWSTASTFEPDRLRDEGTAIAVGFTHGSLQYNRFDFAAPAAVIRNVEDGEDGPVATTILTMELCSTDGVSADDHTIVLD